jgi:hypothetical protein
MVDISSSNTGQALVLRRVENEQVSEVRSFLTKEPEPLPEGEKPRRRRPAAPRPISGPDEAALSWYFGQGLSIYEKSTFGPIVQKIAMDGYSSTTCGTCDGAGIIEEGGGVTLDDKCRGCDGSGREPHKAGREQRWCLTCDGLGRETPYEIEISKGGWCPTCRGTGSGCVERKAMRRARCVWCRPEPYIKTLDDRTGEVTKAPLVTAWVPKHSCPNCLGVGDAPLTAKPVMKGEEAGGVIGNDAALTRFAITSRRAGAVKDISPALHAALEAFYGDTGSRWALTSFGRLFALSHLTPAGKKLARMGIDNPERKGKTKKKTRNVERLIEAAIQRGARGEADRLAKELAEQRRNALSTGEDPDLAAVELNAQERIGVQANLQLSQFKGKRKELIDAAREQAAELYARAARAWNSVSTSKGEKNATARLLANLARLGHGSLASKLQTSAQISWVEIASAKESMRVAGYFPDEVAEAFRTALRETAGGAT